MFLFFFTSSNQRSVIFPPLSQKQKGESEEQSKGTADEKKMSRSTAVSVQTAQAERGAKIQTNNKKTKQAGNKMKYSDVQVSWSILQNDGTEDESRSSTSINQSIVSSEKIRERDEYERI